MLGHSRPCGPLCLPRNYLHPDSPSGDTVRRALVFMLVCLTLLELPSLTYGQRIQFPSEIIQDESDPLKSFENTPFTGLEPVLKSSWSTGTGLIKKQIRPLLTRLELPPLSRLEQKRIPDGPRLAELVKSRDFPLSLQGSRQVLTFEHNSAGLFQTKNQLLDRQFSDVPHAIYQSQESIPVVVRQSLADQQLFFYLANASPWRLRIHLKLKEEVSKQTIQNIESLLQASFNLATNPDDIKSLTVVLGPYDMAGGSTETLGPIKSYTFEYLGDVASELRKRVFGLQVKLQQAQQAKPLRLLSNPEFLPGKSTKSKIDGWEIGQQPPSRFKCLNDSDWANKPDGKTQKSLTTPVNKNEIGQSTRVNAKRIKSHLQIRSSAKETTWVRSQPIAPTETRRLSISVWLRIPQKTDDASGDQQTPDIRIAIDGRTPTKDYYRFGVVGQEPVNSLASLRSTWKRFVVHFDELPNDLTDLRIGFDVVGNGLIDIGHVELFDRWFDSSEAKAITQLLASADAMLRQPAQFDRCRRLLEEPWAVFLDDHFSLKPTPTTAQKPVPMFGPKPAKASTAKRETDKQKQDDSKAGRSLTR